MKKNLLIAISVLTLVCGVCSVGAATTSDTTASGSAVTVENKHKDGERQKGDMAKVTAVTSDTITVTKADGDTATPPEKPSANDDGTDRPEPPTKPDGDTATPEKHSGEKGEKPEMKFSSETTTIDLSSVKIYKMGENHQKTECTYSDISADDVVTIVYADDGTTVSEIVINKAPKTEKTSTTEA